MRPCIERACGPALSEHAALHLSEHAALHLSEHAALHLSEHAAVHRARSTSSKSSTLSSQVLHRPAACGLHCPSAAAVVTKSRNSLVPSPPSSKGRTVSLRWSRGGNRLLCPPFRLSFVHIWLFRSFSLRNRWSLLLTWRNSRGWLPHPRLCSESKCDEDLGASHASTSTRGSGDLLRRQCRDNHFSLCFESCFATRSVQDVTTHTTQLRAPPPIRHF